MGAAKKLDAVSLAVMNSRLGAIAEEMGVVLGQSGFSPNIKERRDYSCALFDSAGEMVAQAAHIPVHLGSTPLSVRAAIERLELSPGDIAAVNDPFAGGTHLPDVTLVAPIFLPREQRPFAFAANRAHHADIGGMAPGSMALATEIYQEGFRLPPVKIVTQGKPARDVFELFLANTRVKEEREGDLRAQIAALGVGDNRLLALVSTMGRDFIANAMEALKDYSDRLMRAALRKLPAGIYRAEDFLDDDGFGSGPIRLAVVVDIRNGRAIVDFTGSASQVHGSVNANYAITLSATFYVMKCLAAEAIPPNEGLMRPIKVIAPPGTVLNALAPAAVAGGNVETSQRIVDVLFKALAKAAPERIPAASSGSMSNLTVGGYDSFRKRHFSYYETVAGGAGAAPGHPGASGIHTHMTNTLNTPIEALEAYYPMRITEYRLRRGSGGRGR
ncbi:MAG: hydantoinase B/oxoprolinase family protein [Candidatus Binataceae bacterium]